MPEGPDGKTIIIVKKVSGHGGHHGGAWKVAYADFVTAMMALFMVLWLVNSAAEPTRQRIASYFRKPGIFQKGSGNPIEMGGGGILPDAFSPPTEGNAQIQTSDKIYQVEATSGRVKELYDEGQGSKEFQYAPKLDGGKDLGTTGEDSLKAVTEVGKSNETQIEQTKLEELKTEIEKLIKNGSENSAEGKKSEIEGILGDVEIKIDQRGLVLEIMDTEKASMFPVGQALVMAEAETKLLEIGRLLSKVSNPIDIEGHTDSRPFKIKGLNGYDNWTLSSDRAHAARRILERSGFAKGQIARVVGYADERPRDLENPLNPSNRRITISMRYSNRAKEALEGTSLFETGVNQKKLDNKSKTPTSASVNDKTKVSNDFVGAKQENVSKTPSQLNEVKPTPASIPEKSIAQVQDDAKKAEAGLRVEMSTVVPEGERLEERSTNDEEKKEIIFGGKNNFFKK